MSGRMPLVHGYIRMEDPDETEIALMRQDIGSYCTSNGYRLGSIFIDRGVPDNVFTRTGFIDLLDAVRLTDAHAVTVPTDAHLSTDAFIHDALRRMVERVGAAVLVVCESNHGGQQAKGGRDSDSAASGSS